MKRGQGKVFKKAIENTVGFIKNEIENTFTSKEYERAKNMLLREYNESGSRHMNELNELAKRYGFIYTRNENGFVSIPLKDGVPMNEADYRTLSKKEYEEIQKKSADLNMASIDIFKSIRDSEEEFSDKLKKLDSDFALRTVSIFMDRLEQRFEGNGKLKKYINMLKHDIIENVEVFKHSEENLPASPLFMLQNKSFESFSKRYEVNLFIDNSNNDSAPVVTETNPTYSNLLGHVEFENQMGFLQTGVDKIIPGSIHRANGGYLILQAGDILQNIFSWKGLLRALLNEEINIETMENALGFIMTAGLKPEPIPLSLKVIIVGDPYTYSILYEYDELFVKLFKIRADFDIEMKRNENNLMKMAKFISAQCENEKLNHLSLDAVCRVVEYSSRIADSKEKLSSRFNKIVELLYEADVWSKKEEEKLIESRHVEKAVNEMIFRNNMYQEKILEYFENDTYILDVEGYKVGEINGLAVVSTGQYSFGNPSKITVSTYNGKAGLINIEREARTSGKIHDKGVMIINGYLGYKYAQERPLALSASIVFEQLYSGIDGDSASSTELYAILSSLAEIPVNQGIAVTGSVNQRGLIQPIGGVNEKIEGYYEVCRIKGLTGEQGVIIQ